MVRETFGQAVDDALAQLQVSGVPREAVAVIRQRLRRDKRIVAAAIDVAGMIEILGPGETERAFLTGDREKINAATRRLWAQLAGDKVGV